MSETNLLVDTLGHQKPLMYVVRLVVHICGVDRGYPTSAGQYSKLMQYPVVPRKSDSLHPLKSSYCGFHIHDVQLRELEVPLVLIIDDSGKQRQDLDKVVAVWASEGFTPYDLESSPTSWMAVQEAIWKINH